MPQTPPGSKPQGVTVIPRLVSLLQPSSLPWNGVQLAVESLSSLPWNRCPPCRGIRNQIRGLLLEYGIEVAQGRAALQRRLPEILEDADNGLSARFRAELSGLAEELRHLNERVAHYDEQIEQIAQGDAQARALMTIPGVGAKGATALLAAVAMTRGC